MLSTWIVIVKILNTADVCHDSRRLLFSQTASLAEINLPNLNLNALFQSYGLALVHLYILFFIITVAFSGCKILQGANIFKQYVFTII